MIKNIIICLLFLFPATASADFLVRPERNILEGISIVPSGAIERNIVSILQEKGIPGERISLDLGQYSKGIRLVQYDSRYDVKMLEFDLRPSNKRFEATYRFIPNDKSLPYEDVKIKGSFDTFISVPVLQTSKSKGEIVTEEDITIIEMNSKSVKRGAITDPYDIIGKQLKSAVRALKLVRRYQLVEPRIIERRDAVDIVFNSETLNLRTIGTALEDGGKGDIIKVRNNASNKTIKALVVSNNLVEAQVNSSMDYAYRGDGSAR